MGWPCTRLSSVVTRVLVLAAFCPGCDRRPQAPSLRDSPVYHNTAEGFRFLVPDGWMQTASSVLPPGEIRGDTFLVRYRVRSPEPGATLQIECSADSPEADPMTHHAEPSYGVAQWRQSEPADPIAINGVAADRLVYTGSNNKRTMTKEVVFFRRNQRIYAFVGLFWSTDDKARQQIRRAVASTIWDS